MDQAVSWVKSGWQVEAKSRKQKAKEWQDRLKAELADLQNPQFKPGSHVYFNEPGDPDDAGGFSGIVISQEGSKVTLRSGDDELGTPGPHSRTEVVDVHDSHVRQDRFDPKHLASMLGLLLGTPDSLYPMWDWLAKRIRSGEINENNFGIARDVAQKASGLIDTFQANNQKQHIPNYNQMSLQELEEWVHNTEQSPDVMGSLKDSKTVYKFPDGWRVDLVGHEDMDVDAPSMSNCMSYPFHHVQVENGESLFYSLRNPAGRPMLTIKMMVDPKSTVNSEPDHGPWTNHTMNQNRWKISEVEQRGQSFEEKKQIRPELLKRFMEFFESGKGANGITNGDIEMPNGGHETLANGKLVDAEYKDAEGNSKHVWREDHGDGKGYSVKEKGRDGVEITKEQVKVLSNGMELRKDQNRTGMGLYDQSGQEIASMRHTSSMDLDEQLFVFSGTPKPEVVQQVKSVLTELSHSVVPSQEEGITFVAPLFSNREDSIIAWEDDIKPYFDLGLQLDMKDDYGKRALKRVAIKAMSDGSLEDPAWGFQTKTALDFAAHILGFEYWEDEAGTWMSDPEGDDRLVAVKPVVAPDGSRLEMRADSTSPDQWVGKFTSSDGHTQNNIYLYEDEDGDFVTSGWDARRPAMQEMIKRNPNQWKIAPDDPHVEDPSELSSWYKDYQLAHALGVQMTEPSIGEDLILNCMRAETNRWDIYSPLSKHETAEALHALYHLAGEDLEADRQYAEEQLHEDFDEDWHNNGEYDVQYHMNDVDPPEGHEWDHDSRSAFGYDDEGEQIEHPEGTDLYQDAYETAEEKARDSMYDNEYGDAFALSNHLYDLGQYHPKPQPGTMPGPIPRAEDLAKIRQEQHGGYRVSSWTREGMGANGDLPEGLTFTTETISHKMGGDRLRTNAVLNGEVIGFIDVYVQNRKLKGRIAEVYVKPEYRRTGVATILYEQAGQPQHARPDDFTDSGKAWKRSLGNSPETPDDWVKVARDATPMDLWDTLNEFDLAASEAFRSGKLDMKSPIPPDLIQQILQMLTIAAHSSHFDDELHAACGQSLRNVQAFPNVTWEQYGPATHPIMDALYKRMEMGKRDVPDTLPQHWAKAAQDYRMNHQPSEDGAPLYDLTEGGVFPADVYEHPDHYGASRYDIGSADAIKVINTVRGNPNAMVTIYRGIAPVGERQIEHGGKINMGDWVSISYEYAKQHAMHHENEAHDGPVLSAQVPASSLRSEGYLMEWGYYGPSVMASDPSGKMASMDDDQLRADANAFMDKMPNTFGREAAHEDEQPDDGDFVLHDDGEHVSVARWANGSPTLLSYFPHPEQAYQFILGQMMAHGSGEVWDTAGPFGPYEFSDGFHAYEVEHAGMTPTRDDVSDLTLPESWGDDRLASMWMTNPTKGTDVTTAHHGDGRIVAVKGRRVCVKTVHGDVWLDWQQTSPKRNVLPPPRPSGVPEY